MRPLGHSLCPGGSAVMGTRLLLLRRMTRLYPSSGAVNVPMEAGATRATTVLTIIFHRDAGLFSRWQSYNLQTYCCIHTTRSVNTENQIIEESQQNQRDAMLVDESGRPNAKRKKLKGRRAVTRFLKSLRWKKKKEFQRMTVEEKILYKLKLARSKEERLVSALKKIEPDDLSEPTHDLEMGQKCKNYVPVGRHGIYQGVILNMHLHWKKHQTLQVIVKTFTSDEVKEIASELARLSGGIVLDIQEGNTIIVYRGKNYAQPPPEIMSPRVTLSRKKKLAKDHQGENAEKGVSCISDSVSSMSGKKDSSCSVHKRKSIKGSGMIEDENYEIDNDSVSKSITYSESEDLSDIFETDSNGLVEDLKERPLYLDSLDKFPSENNDNEPDDFVEHLRKIASLSDETDSSAKELKISELHEIDKIFLRASSLLKKR
ncbi:hypothetical protein ABZP36_002729 [Zizania latifolia]